MFRYIVPIVILIVSGIIFAVFTKPTYGQIADLKAKSAAYEEALGNARQLQSIRDELTATYNSFNPEDIKNIETLLPDTVDSVQLVIDLDDMAQSHGLTFKNSSFDAADSADSQKTATDLLLETKEYRTSKISFVVEGSYENFKSFLADLERSLRLVDIESLDFNAATVAGSNNFSFQVDLVTYWLRSR